MSVGSIAVKELGECWGEGVPERCLRALVKHFARLADLCLAVMAVGQGP